MAMVMAGRSCVRVSVRVRVCSPGGYEERRESEAEMLGGGRRQGWLGAGQVDSLTVLTGVWAKFRGSSTERQGQPGQVSRTVCRQGSPELVKCVYSALRR